MDAPNWLFYQNLVLSSVPLKASVSNGNMSSSTGASSMNEITSTFAELPSSGVSGYGVLL